MAQSDTNTTICSIDGCEKGVLVRGWCSTHYWRWYRRGDAEWQPPTFMDRLRKHTDTQDPDSCWLWTGAVKDHGYGHVGDHGKYYNAHIWSYINLVGPIPKGLQLDHTCHSSDPTCPGGDTCLHRRCVNPDHLEPVTVIENNRRARKMACLRGHDRTDPANIYINPKTGGRTCRPCHAIHERERRQRVSKLETREE